jgi:hypothetical protein
MTTAQHSASPVSRPRQLLVTVRDELRERRRVRASYRELERSLSSYNSGAEVDELLAMVADQEGPDAERVRRILARNMQHQATHRVVA